MKEMNINNKIFIRTVLYVEEGKDQTESKRERVREYLELD